MGLVFEKINASSEHKNHLINIYSVGEKIHDTIDCLVQPCDCLQYLDDVSILIESMDNRQGLTDNVKVFFFLKQVKNTVERFYFLIKLIKNLALKSIGFKKMFFLQQFLLKLKKLNKIFVLNKIEKLEGKLYVLEKAFL